MKDRHGAKPLYRKVNTKARGVHHLFGRDYKRDRAKDKQKNFDVTKVKMKSGVSRGLDYTPLFRFLLTKVGEDFDAVFSEAIKRLPKPDPIYWMVIDPDVNSRAYFRAGETSLFSTLFVDEQGRLALVDPDLRNEDLYPDCPCCTHTFNGELFLNPYKPNLPRLG